MPPIDVPIIRSGFTSATFCLSSVSASAGCSGRSKATTFALGKVWAMSLTVPEAADEPKPWLYMMVFPFISSGNCLT